MYKKIPAWTVHLLTASGVLIALLTLFEIHNQHYINALWLMCAAIFIDAIDGTLARLVNIKEVIPNIDGALLDNIVDFLNYVVTPCFFILLCPDLVPSPMVWPILIAVSLSSCYQFTQSDAKTEDHFFKGFPCYWNLVVLYLYVFTANPIFSAFTLLVLSFLVFAPIKYVYPSRLDYLTKTKALKIVMFIASVLYGFHCLLMLYNYPTIPTYLIVYSTAYISFYMTFSIIRTIAPLIKAKNK